MWCGERCVASGVRRAARGERCYVRVAITRAINNNGPNGVRNRLDKLGQRVYQRSTFDPSSIPIKPVNNTPSVYQMATNR